MKKIALFLLFGVFVLVSGYSKEVKVAFGLALPPYVIAESNSGIEFDIIKRALEIKGHKLTPVYLPFARVPQALKEKSADAAATIIPASGVPGVSYSESHITYQNVALTLAAKKIKIDKISDLTGKKIAVFQNAKSYLGPEFLKAVNDPNKYTEVANQALQIGMLYKDKVDALVMDINIFDYYKGKEASQYPVTIHNVFAPTNYQVGFLDPQLMKDFNEGLKTLKSTGEYDKIFKKYK